MSYEFSFPRRNGEIPTAAAKLLIPDHKATASASALRHHAGAGGLRTRIDQALFMAYEFGQTSGDQHRLWVIDQMVRKLTAAEYKYWVTRYEVPDKEEWAKWETGLHP